MRINELHLQDFGMFHDYTISFDPQAQLIYGDNEQGLFIHVSLVR